MSVEWYDMIARKNGGYKSNAVFTVGGLSGETVFEERLISLLPSFNSVLDAGCGHGEFTLKMAKHTANIIGLDNSVELVKIAELIKQQYQTDNVKFIIVSTKRELPFKDEQFDLVYTRRGPTSILDHIRIIRPCGIVFGIHSADMDRVKEKLETNGYIDIKIEVFDQAFLVFPNEREFAKHLSAMHGNPDYTLPENKPELEQLIAENLIDGRLTLKEWRYIWQARRP
jgi:SAM-dependent methyltransferase